MKAFLQQFKVTGIESPVILLHNNSNTHCDCDNSTGECGDCGGGGHCGD